MRRDRIQVTRYPPMLSRKGFQRDGLTNSRVRINYVNSNGERSDSRKDRGIRECRHDNEPLNNCRDGERFYYRAAAR